MVVRDETLQPRHAVADGVCLVGHHQRPRPLQRLPVRIERELEFGLYGVDVGQSRQRLGEYAPLFERQCVELQRFAELTGIEGAFAVFEPEPGGLAVGAGGRPQRGLRVG